MASAEQLLHEAQYAFHNIGYEDSREKRRNTSRAKSLAKKILRKYPTSMEAQEARSILRRLGDEAYGAKPAARDVHDPHTIGKADETARSRQRSTAQAAAMSDDATVLLDWGGLLALLIALPKAVLAIFLITAYLLFRDIWLFLLLPLVALVVFTRPFRQLLDPAKRQEMNNVVARINDWLRRQRDSNDGFL